MQEKDKAGRSGVQAPCSPAVFLHTLLLSGRGMSLKPEEAGGFAEEGNTNHVSLARGPRWAGSRAGPLNLEGLPAANTRLGLGQMPSGRSPLPLHVPFISGQCGRTD